jgi:Na+-driven multidrug efflux pump
LGYLRVAALGAPTATLWLVVNGIFRGLGDTTTPLVWALLFTLMNAVLDPILIFPLGLGAAGAAAGTAISQTLALYPLLRALSKKVGTSGRSDVPALFAAASRTSLQDSLKRYANAGGFVLLRTLGKKPPSSAPSPPRRTTSASNSVRLGLCSLCRTLAPLSHARA